MIRPGDAPLAPPRPFVPREVVDAMPVQRAREAAARAGYALDGPAPLPEPGRTGLETWRVTLTKQAEHQERTHPNDGARPEEILVFLDKEARFLYAEVRPSGGTHETLAGLRRQLLIANAGPGNRFHVDESELVTLGNGVRVRR